MTLVSDIGDMAIWTASIAWLLWAVQYTVLAPWWHHVTGITLVGLALLTVATYAPSLMALADPGGFATFAGTTWYHWLATGIVIASAIFAVTRIGAWEYIRRHPGPLPSQMAERIAELETENAALREQLEGQR
jgi:hypothetical protein